MKPRVTKYNKNQENYASKTTQGNHHKQNDSISQQVQECPKEPDSAHTAPAVADTRPSYGPPQCYHSGPPMQMAYSICNRLYININNLTREAPGGNPPVASITVILVNPLRTHTFQHRHL